jgi:hypothetical protein
MRAPRRRAALIWERLIGQSLAKIARAISKPDHWIGEPSLANLREVRRNSPERPVGSITPFSVISAK